MKNDQLKKMPGITCLLVLLAFCASAQAGVGKVVYGYGNNYALDADGNRRDLGKGAEIFEGDTLVTGRGRLHVRLVDTGFVSIYPNSKYKIEKFRYSAKTGKPAMQQDGTNESKPAARASVTEAKEEQGFFSLLKGAARQVTGYIGRKYHDNFRFKTTVATIGIRGTGFFARLCQADCFDAEGNPMQDGLYVKNNTGVITMKTNAGEVVLGQGQSAFAASNEDSPQQVIQPPVAYNLVTPPIELYDFDEKVLDVEEQKNIEEQLAGAGTEITPPVTPPVSAAIQIDTLDYISSTNTGFSILPGSIDTANATDSITQNGNDVEHFEGTGIFIDGGALVADKGAGVLQESGVNQTLGVVWNRWTGMTITEGGSAVTTLDDNLHLIGTNNITQNLPTGVVSYAGVGGTSPTKVDSQGGVEVGTQTVSATIDLGAGTLQSFNVITDFTNASYNLSGSVQSPLQATNNQVTLTGSCLGNACGSIPDGNASLNFVGQQAEGIYGVYNFTDLSNAVSGSYVASQPPAQGLE